MKRSLALALFHPSHPGQVVAVQRPPWERELPGIWGLPAVTLHPGESVEGAIARCARTKLGVEVRPRMVLGEGWQEGAAGPQTLTLWAVDTQEDTFTLPPAHPGSAVTLYISWQWARPVLLEEGARRGSLCCRLFLAWSAAAPAPW